MATVLTLTLLVVADIALCAHALPTGRSNYVSSLGNQVDPRLARAHSIDCSVGCGTLFAGSRPFSVNGDGDLTFGSGRCDAGGHVYDVNNIRVGQVLMGASSQQRIHTMLLRSSEHYGNIDLQRLAEHIYRLDHYMQNQRQHCIVGCGATYTAEPFVFDCKGQLVFGTANVENDANGRVLVTNSVTKNPVGVLNRITPEAINLPLFRHAGEVVLPSTTDAERQALGNGRSQLSSNRPKTLNNNQQRVSFTANTQIQNAGTITRRIHLQQNVDTLTVSRPRQTGSNAAPIGTVGHNRQAVGSSGLGVPTHWDSVPVLSQFIRSGPIQQAIFPALQSRRLATNIK